MKSMLALCAAAAFAAGCASQGDVQVAQADCKITPITTASVAGGKPRNVDSIQRSRAEADLATSSYRFRNLQRNGLAMNNVEDALRDCNR
jgi:hypothetical protein